MPRGTAVAVVCHRTILPHHISTKDLPKAGVLSTVTVFLDVLPFVFPFCALVCEAHSLSLREDY
jgi:hypothetical protein